MELVVRKILCLLAMFGLMLAAILTPVRVMQSDLDKAVRYRRAVAFSNSFGGGVFLATCFNALLPAVRDKVSVCLLLHHRIPFCLDLETHWHLMYCAQCHTACHKYSPLFIYISVQNNNSVLKSKVQKPY